MYRDDEAQLHAEALGMIAALLESAESVVCRQSLTNAYEVLDRARPAEKQPRVPADVGVRRRAADFKKTHELLMSLSLCPEVSRENVIVAMMFLTKAESHWNSAAPVRSGSGFSRLRRRQTDAEAKARAAAEQRGSSLR